MAMQPGGLSGDDGASGADARHPDPLVGRNVGGKFVLERLLGAGAMGAVYRARQTALEKVVAIKVMHGELALDPMFAARFHREAKAASRLDHPNSIRVLDYGQDPDGLLYIAMEYLDGRDLAHLIEREFPFPTARIVDLMSQALGAIAVAHDMGITHRDLKPENIMVLQRRTDDGVEIDVVKVCDFGIAKLVDNVDAGANGDDSTAAVPAGQAKGKLTTAGLVIGTPAYMSPEQGRGEAIDGRSDLYSMGVILFQLLTGQLPFDAPSAIGIVIKHQTEPPPPPSSLRGSIDPHLEAVCLKALEKAPGDRYQTARDLRAAIRAGLEAPVGLSGGSGPYSAALSRAPQPTASGPSLPSTPSDPGVAIARTELQLAPVTLSPSTSASAAGVSSPGVVVEPTLRSRRWPVAAGVLAGLLVVSGAVAIVGRPRPRAAANVRANVGTTSELPSSELNRHDLTSPAPSALASGANAGPVGEPPTPLKAPDSESSRRSVGAAIPVVLPRHSTGASTPPKGGLAPPAAGPVEGARAAEPTSPEPAPPQLVPSPPAASPPPLQVAPPPPPAPAAPAFNLDSASVEIGTPFNLAQTGATSVSEGISHVRADLVRCYKEALPGMTGAIEGKMTLHIEADDETGAVVKTELAGSIGGGALARCVREKAMRIRLRQHDTGAPSADIPLEFKAR